jgi:hypothetical protein
MSSDETEVALIRTEMRRETDDEQAREAAEQHTKGRQTGGGSMDRVTARMPDEMIRALDDAVDDGKYPNRTAAIRDAVRERFMRGGGWR